MYEGGPKVTQGRAEIEKIGLREVNGGKLFEEIWTGYRGGRETCLIQPVVVKFSELLLPYLEANVSTITEDGLNRTGRSCGCSAVSAPLVAFSRKALDTAFPILLDRQKPKLPLHRPDVL